VTLSWDENSEGWSSRQAMFRGGAMSEVWEVLMEGEYFTLALFGGNSQRGPTSFQARGD